MNKHIKPIELVENWLADNNSVSQEARTINAAAANAARAAAAHTAANAANAASAAADAARAANAAAANDAYIADFWVAGYYKFIKEPNND